MKHFTECVFKSAKKIRICNASAVRETGNKNGDSRTQLNHSICQLPYHLTFTAFLLPNLRANSAFWICSFPEISRISHVPSPSVLLVTEFLDDATPQRCGNAKPIHRTISAGHRFVFSKFCKNSSSKQVPAASYKSVSHTFVFKPTVCIEPAGRLHRVVFSE